MKKHLYLLTLILCLVLSACGTHAPVASGENSNSSAESIPNFETDSIAVYDITMVESGVVTDETLISELAASAQIESWKSLIELGDQVSAIPVYVLDFGNGTVIGWLGDGYIMVGTAFEFLSEDHERYRFADGNQYQVPVAVTDLLEEITVSATAMEEIPAEPEEISVPTPEDNVNISVESLMTEFMNGGLEGCSFNDGSEASEHFRAWSEMLGGEEIPLETETPQSYWESWCEHIDNLYAGSGYEYFVEQDYPVSAKYIELKYGIDG